MITLQPTSAAPRSALLERYLASVDSPTPLAPRLGGPPTLGSIGELASRLASASEVAPADTRAELVASLLAAHEPLDPDSATLRSIRALGDPRTLVVATGQQPGLLTGPLYSVLKAASTIATARRLERELAVPVVPLYWVASDDHDLPEIEGCFTLGEDGALHRHRVNLQRTAWPSSHLAVPEAARDVVSRFMLDVPSGEFRDAVADLAEPRPGEPWARWFSRILLQLFPEQGLVLFEPTLHPELLAPWMRLHANRPAEVAECLRRGAEELRTLGLDPSLPADRPSGLFLFDGERRRRYDPASQQRSVEDALDEKPLPLTADAALRPLIQSSLFRVAAVVGGPGELAYWLQLTELFDAFEIPRPVFLPRLAATLVEPRVRRALKSLSLEEDAMLTEPLPIEQAVGLAGGAGDPSEDPTLLAGKATAALAREALEAFSDTLKEVGGPIPSRIRDLKKVFGSSLDRVLDLAGRHLREQSGISRKRVDLVQSSGRPHGKTQDRVLCALPYLSRSGMDLFARIARTAEPFDFRHQLIFAEPVR